MQTESRIVGRPFKPGESGNPGGRPKDTDEVKEGKEMLRRAMPEAVRAVVEVLNNPEAKVSERLTAATIILDRVLGKAAQPIVADIYEDESSHTMTLDEMYELAKDLVETVEGKV